jgi:hypothetical protein
VTNSTVTVADVGDEYVAWGGSRLDSSHLGVAENDADLLVGSAWRGVVGSVLNLELFLVRPWRRCGEERQVKGRPHLAAAEQKDG